MSPRTYRALQALLLLGLGLFFLQKVVSGTLFWYINQRFMFLVLLAGLGFLGLASLTLAARKPAAHAPHEHGAEAHDHDHTHDHAHADNTLKLSLLIAAIPLALGLLVPARPLGSTAIANKGLNVSLPLTASNTQPLQLQMASTERTVLDWVRAFNYSEDAKIYEGQAADVIGFVYHDPELAEGFMLSRFAVTCCSADATAIGVVVAWPGAAQLEENGWVRVQGTVDSVLYAGRATPRITAITLEGIAPPEQPYLYP